jgi:hypothetical protein
VLVFFIACPTLILVAKALDLWAILTPELDKFLQYLR